MTYEIPDPKDWEQHPSDAGAVLRGRWATFKKNYDESIALIKDALEGEVADYEKEYQHLIRWLFYTQHNPYGIFKNEWAAGCIDDAEGFARICHEIHHALVDDGDICFPVVNGVPQIAFCWRHDEEFVSSLLKEDETNVRIRKELGIYEPPTLEFLKDAYEFTEAFDRYCIEETERLKGYEQRMKEGW